MRKLILDACCGSKMFWFDKNNKNVIFVNNRELEDEIIYQSKDGKTERKITIKPDIVADFRNLPFEDNTFYHIVFDPPHLNQAGNNAWIVKKYGKLPCDWRQYIRDGFNECWRVLRPFGTLIFKWNENQIPVKELIKVIKRNPLYGHKSGRLSQTHWMAFLKIPEK